MKNLMLSLLVMLCVAPTSCSLNSEETDVPNNLLSTLSEKKITIQNIVNDVYSSGVQPTETDLQRIVSAYIPDNNGVDVVAVTRSNNVEISEASLEILAEIQNVNLFEFNSQDKYETECLSIIAKSNTLSESEREALEIAVLVNASVLNAEMSKKLSQTKGWLDDAWDAYVKLEMQKWEDTKAAWNSWGKCAAAIVGGAGLAALGGFGIANVPGAVIGGVTGALSAAGTADAC